jgi:hypothetical protein
VSIRNSIHSSVRPYLLLRPALILVGGAINQAIPPAAALYTALSLRGEGAGIAVMITDK